MVKKQKGIQIRQALTNRRSWQCQAGTLVSTRRKAQPVNVDETKSVVDWHRPVEKCSLSIETAFSAGWCRWLHFSLSTPSCTFRHAPFLCNFKLLPFSPRSNEHKTSFYSFRSKHVDPWKLKASPPLTLLYLSTKNHIWLQASSFPWTGSQVEVSQLATTSPLLKIEVTKSCHLTW